MPTNKELEEQLKAKNAENVELRKQLDGLPADDARKMIDGLTKRAEAAEADLAKVQEAAVQPSTQQGADPAVVILDRFLAAAGLRAPIVKIRGHEQPSEDRRTWHEFSADRYLFVDEFNFRTASGYDDNWKLNAESALKRGLALDFGPADKSGLGTYEKLPPFDKQNRVVVILAVLPPVEAEG